MRVAPFIAVTLVLSALLTRTAIAGPALVFDTSNGKVLYAQDIDDHWYPASLTKIMTAYLMFDAIKKGRLKRDQKISVSKTAHRQPPSKIGLPVGGKMSVEMALKSLIIKSANDVAVMVGEAISGSVDKFVADMNATAKRLGMTRTRFVNPNGLPAAGQVTTARDLAKLARAVLKDFPEYNHYWSLPSMRIGKIRLRSHNKLLKTFEGADGMKTGFICDSGFNVVATATRNGRKLVAIVLGEESGASRTLRAASLLDYGFQQQAWKTIFNTQTVDNMAFDPKPAAVVSVREEVTSWSCSRKKKKKKKIIKKKSTKTKKSAKPKTIKQKSSSAKPAKKKPVAKAVKTKQAPAKKPKAAKEKAAAPSPAPTVTGTVAPAGGKTKAGKCSHCHSVEIGTAARNSTSVGLDTGPEPLIAISGIV